jgi:hypothetical protein
MLKKTWKIAAILGCYVAGAALGALGHGWLALAVMGASIVIAVTL